MALGASVRYYSPDMPRRKTVAKEHGSYVVLLTTHARRLVVENMFSAHWPAYYVRLPHRHVGSRTAAGFMTPGELICTRLTRAGPHRIIYHSVFMWSVYGND